MKEIIDTLHTGGYSCVIANGKEVRTFTQRGVADLYALYRQDASFLKGSFVADKVVGKAAAALMILGGVERVFTDVISELALELFEHSSVKVEYTVTVPRIINRNHTGWCPLETICCAARTADDCLPLIEDFVNRMPPK